MDTNPRRVLDAACGRGGVGCGCCNNTRPRGAAGSRRARARGADALRGVVRTRVSRAVAREIARDLAGE